MVVLVCLGVLAILPRVESQATPQRSSHGGDCPRLSTTRARVSVSAKATCDSLADGAPPKWPAVLVRVHQARRHSPFNVKSKPHPGCNDVEWAVLVVREEGLNLRVDADHQQSASVAQLSSRATTGSMS